MLRIPQLLGALGMLPTSDNPDPVRTQSVVVYTERRWAVEQPWAPGCCRDVSVRHVLVVDEVAS